MSCLRYLCLFGYSSVQYILCWFSFVLFFVLFSFSSSCVHYIASVSGLSIFNSSSVFSNVYQHNMMIRYAIENDKHQ